MDDDDILAEIHIFQKYHAVAPSVPVAQSDVHSWVYNRRLNKPPNGTPNNAQRPEEMDALFKYNRIVTKLQN